MSKDEQIAELTQELRASKQENAYLRQELATLKKLIFATKSERYKNQEDDQQLHLFVDDQSEALKDVSAKASITYKRKL